MEKQSTGLRKRQQISKANQTMFLAIAGASVVVGFSLVLMLFLVQRIWFGEKVIAEKNHTVAVLQKNLDSVNALKDNIRVLNTNEDLKSILLKDGDSPLQSVLDAASANSTAMASSLQVKLLSNVSGITIESLKVDPVVGVETSSDGSGSIDSSDPSSHSIGFSFSVSTAAGNSDALRQVLMQIEKSIRPFNITNLSVESQGSRLVMTATGVGYYDPAQVVQLTDKVVKP